MAETRRFAYNSLDELTEDLARRQIDLPVSDDISVLAAPIAFGRLTVPNRMAAQPMEGCDSLPNGAPSDLTVRKYRRFAAGGSGLLWWEACAICPEARANPRQIMLTEETAAAFEAMVDAARAAADEAMGHRPVCVLQLTHSGRYSRPVDGATPIIAHHSAILDPRHNLPPDYPLITDEQLDALQDAFAAAAVLASQVGFDAVDIKSCHRYLLSELLASFTRENSRYGGSYANRTRMIRETVRKVRQAVGESIELTSRINCYDAIAYPYGWGVDRDDACLPDLAEPIALMGELQDEGFGGVNVTVGNPYFNPHVNRPADWMISDWPDPPEDPLAGVERIIHVARDIQQAHPALTVVGSGYSWLRQYFPHFAAGVINAGWAGIAGLGRGALAYPNFARDIIQNGEMNRHSVCVACSSCTQIMRDHGRSGCVVRDNDVYGPIFREGRAGDPARLRKMASSCRRCPDAMCVTRCPASVDIPGFLGALADGDEREAYRILTCANILPEICGTVCPVEVQCQSACIQNYIGDGALPIAEIQRRLSHRAVSAGWAALEVPHDCTGRHVAIVGAGPGGLSAAAELLRRGHRVTVFDRGRRMGGKLGSVIPAQRLTPSQAESEIRAVFAKVPADRATWRLGRAMGPKMTLDDLLGEGFDAVVLAFGLGNSASLAGRDLPEGVIDANSFLQQMNANIDHACGPRVVVVGGGNSAVDAAVCAKRRGARDVFLLYRRSYREMPAWPRERDSALHAGVHLLLLCQPVEYLADESGRLRAVRVVRTELGPPQADGRRRAEAIAGSGFELAADLVVEAVGEQALAGIAGVLGGVTLTDRGLIETAGDTLATSRAGVWAAGDAVNGGTTVVQAIGQGRRAAEEIDTYLAGNIRK